MALVCPSCKQSDFETDLSRGDTVCTNCGVVVEENSIREETNFAENADGSASVVGQYVGGDGQVHHFMNGINIGSRPNAREKARKMAEETLTRISHQMKIDQKVTSMAIKLYTMVHGKQLTRGRPTLHIIVACLYLACRVETKPNLLIDFSDATEVNVFTLGRVYLFIANELHIALPCLGCVGSKFATSTSYWNPTFTEHWQILNSSLELSPTLLPYKEANNQSRKVPYPLLTDEKNLRSSAQSKMFSVTTRVREYAVNNKAYTRKGLRSPSAHSVRTAAITGRSLFSPVSCPNFTNAEDPKRLRTAQNLRHLRENERLSETRERKRLAQVASHRIDRMYYMQGSASKLHSRHTFDEDQLTKMRDIAISNRQQLSTTPNDCRLENGSADSSSLTVIPTGSETDQQNEQEEAGGENVVEEAEEKGGVNVVEEVEEKGGVNVVEENEEVSTAQQNTFITADEDL